MKRTRKQWLETFIKLAVSGAAALEYRKQLKLKTNVLGPHIKRLGKYQEELAEIKAKESAVAAETKRQADMARVRAARRVRPTVEPTDTSTKITSEFGGLLPPATVDPKPEED